MTFCGLNWEYILALFISDGGDRTLLKESSNEEMISSPTSNVFFDATRVPIQVDYKNTYSTLTDAFQNVEDIYTTKRDPFNQWLNKCYNTLIKYRAEKNNRAVFLSLYMNYIDLLKKTVQLSDKKIVSSENLDSEDIENFTVLYQYYETEFDLLHENIKTNIHMYNLSPMEQAPLHCVAYLSLFAKGVLTYE